MGCVQISISPNLPQYAGRRSRARRRARQDPIDTLCDYLIEDNGATRVLVTSISEDDVRDSCARRRRWSAPTAIASRPTAPSARACRTRDSTAPSRASSATTSRANAAAARTCDPQNDRRDRAGAQVRRPRPAEARLRADIAIFDPADFRTAPPTRPAPVSERRAHHVIVNGTIVVENATHPAPCPARCCAGRRTVACTEPRTIRWSPAVHGGACLGQPRLAAKRRRCPAQGRTSPAMMRIIHEFREYGVISARRPVAGLGGDRARNDPQHQGDCRDASENQERGFVAHPFGGESADRRAQRRADACKVMTAPSPALTWPVPARMRATSPGTATPSMPAPTPSRTCTRARGRPARSRRRRRRRGSATPPARSGTRSSSRAVRASQAASSAVAIMVS